jgi:hypothetical protein
VERVEGSWRLHEARSPVHGQNVSRCSDRDAASAMYGSCGNGVLELPADDEDGSTFP